MKDTKQILDKLEKFKNKVTLPKKSKMIYLVLAVVLVIFFFINIYFSQNVSPIFFGLSNNNEGSAVEFLQKIRLTPEFNQQLSYFEKIYGPGFKNAVFGEERQRDALIKHLEQLLQKSPYSTDILYSLYQLYLGKGDQKTAINYLNQAKQIDPNIR